MMASSSAFPSPSSPAAWHTRRLVVTGTMALVVLAIGIGSIWRAARSHHRYRAAMLQSIEQLDRLDGLETDAAATRAILSAWEQTASQPPPLRGMLRDLGLDGPHDVQESEHAMALNGWVLRRTDLTAATMTATDLQRLVERAHGASHPWCLREIAMTPGAGTPPEFSVRLRFESPVPERR